MDEVALTMNKHRYQLWLRRSGPGHSRHPGPRSMPPGTPQSASFIACWTRSTVLSREF
jgi:hypothetical protein